MTIPFNQVFLTKYVIVHICILVRHLSNSGYNPGLLISLSSNVNNCAATLSIVCFLTLECSYLRV